MECSASLPLLTSISPSRREDAVADAPSRGQARTVKEAVPTFTLSITGVSVAALAL